MNLFKQLFRTIAGIGYALFKMEPDSIKIPRIEAEISQKEVAANEALESFGALIAADEALVKKLEPEVKHREAQIQQLLSSGNDAAAAELVEDFERLESEYNLTFERLTSNQTALKAEFDRTQLDIESLRKELRTIKDSTKRLAAEEKLNDLRKAASGKRFEAAGLSDDLATMRERVEERTNAARGTRIVLDMGTKKTVAEVATTKAAQDASKQVTLARFASKRGIALKTQEKTGTIAPLGEAEAPKENKEQV